VERVQPYLDWLIDHRFAVVFFASVIDSVGLPFPGRVLLVVAGTFTAAFGELALLIGLATVGSVLGDHVLYRVGMYGGTRMLVLYCRLALASKRCVERTVAFFKRFGAGAILLSRVSFGVRLFAAALAGSGHIAYWRFLAYDTAGTLAYATLWLVLGHVFGAAVLERAAAARLLLVIGPAALVGLVLYRLARRWRYGAASARSLPNP
jgi:membrane protein DedA with SNARE-associated domain